MTARVLTLVSRPRLPGKRRRGNGLATSNACLAGQLVTTAVTYLAGAGNTLSSVRYAYDLAGNVASTADGVGVVTSYLRDGLNVTRTLVTSVTLTLSLLDETFDGAGNVLTRTDQAGNVTSFGYLGSRVTAQVDGYGTTAASTTGYGYDLAGNRASVVDAVGNTTSYSYDHAGHVTRKADALGTASYGYNLDGQLTLSTDPSGRKVSYHYDGGRLTSEVWYNSGNTATATQNYTYDGNGFLLTAGNAAGTYTFSYDGGNLTREITPNGLTVSFSHDQAGHVTLQTDSQGGTTSLTWQGDNLVRQTYQDGTHQARVDFSYDLAGHELTQTRYSDVAGTTLVGSSTFSYLGDNFSSILHKDASASVLASFGYGYDGAMRLALRVEDGASTTFDYDSKDQLTQAGSQSYAWDANGNNANAGASTTTGNRLTTDGTWDYAYDGAGNVSSRTNASASVTWSYTFDNANHLLTAVQTSGASTLVSASYDYDAFGNRVRLDVTQGGSTTTTKAAFVALGPPRIGDDLTSWRLYADLNGVGAVGTRHLSGARVNQWLGQVVSGTGVRWALGDYQGPVRLVLNASGVVIDAIAYDAFGAVLSETAPSLAPRLGYAGYERDAWSGMDRAGARYRLGLAWLTQDPLGLGPDSNPYRYVGNSPTNAVDPSGLKLHLTNEEKEIRKGDWNYRWVLLNGTVKGMDDTAKEILNVMISSRWPYKYASKEDLADDVRIRLDTIKAAYEAGVLLASKRWAFDYKVDNRDPMRQVGRYSWVVHPESKAPQHWRDLAYPIPRVGHPGHFVTGTILRSGSTLEQGLDEVYNSKGKCHYVGDCTSTVLLLLLRGISKAGASAKLGKTRIVLTSGEGLFGNLLKHDGPTDLIPGSVRQWKVTGKVPNIQFVEETVIYLGEKFGKRYYFAHPIGFGMESDVKAGVFTLATGKKNPTVEDVKRVTDAIENWGPRLYRQ